MEIQIKTTFEILNLNSKILILKSLRGCKCNRAFKLTIRHSQFIRG
jgi:hypothetical protein